MSDAQARNQQDGSTPLSVGARRSDFPHMAIHCICKSRNPSMWRSPANEISYTVVVVGCGNYMEACGAIATLFWIWKSLSIVVFRLWTKLKSGTLLKRGVWNKLQTFPRCRSAGEKQEQQTLQKMRHRFWKYNFIIIIVSSTSQTNA
jgi:hypothetical protein